LVLDPITSQHLSQLLEALHRYSLGLFDVLQNFILDNLEISSDLVIFLLGSWQLFLQFLDALLNE